ncbi:antitoxin AF2212-like protein [Treponema sp. R80B11-R83G3]
MLVITGVFENERFIPDRPISIPQKKKVTITINEELPATARQSARRAIFDKCRLDLTNFKFNRNEANDYE